MGLWDKVKSKVASVVPAAAPQAHSHDHGHAHSHDHDHDHGHEHEDTENDAAPSPSDDDDGFKRDYALEAKDDMAGFDFRSDIKGYYKGLFYIEQAWEDESERHRLFAQYRIRNEQHFYQVTATHERYLGSAHAAQTWGDQGDIMQLRMDATTEIMRGNIAANAAGAVKGELEPVEGVTLQQWAWVMAGISSGGDGNAMIAQLGVDGARWTRVNDEWNARMSRDTTFTIATEYGKAFATSGHGKYGNAAAAGAAAMGGGEALRLEDAPISFEQYVEIEQAQKAGSERGQDASSVLRQFGMSVHDWSNVSQWWSGYTTANFNKNNQALLRQYNQLSAHFEAKYRSASSDGDLNF